MEMDAGLNSSEHEERKAKEIAKRSSM